MNYKRILIFRPDNIGDVLLFSGALKHIRDLYPGAYITLAVQPHIVNLVELCPFIDACVSIDALTWWGTVKNSIIPYFHACKRLVRKLNRLWNLLLGPFDTVIYPVKSPQAAHLQILRDLNVKKTFGITGCNVNAPQGGYPPGLQPESLFTNGFDVSGYDPWRHEFFTTLDFLKFLGCKVSDINDIKPEVWVADSDRNLLENIQGNDQNIIGLFPGGSFKEKCWNPENYETLGRLMGDKLFVIFGGSEDAGVADQVKSFLVKGAPNAGIINLVGKTTLRELYKSISACNLIISMDSSGLHLAIASETHTIAIVGWWHYGRFIPWGDPKKHIFLTKKVECFHCNVNCKMDRFECIQGVTPEMVAYNANNRPLYQYK